jgi:hypothetical protein
MPQIKVINQQTQTTGELTDTAYGAAVSLDGALTFSAQCAVDVDTPGAKTFAASAVNTTTDVATITAHGYTTGLKGQVANGGALPTGLLASTDYFIIVVDANTVAFASSLALSQAGTKIDLTAQGSGTNTFTAIALATASAILQKSNDNIIWANEGSSTSITAAAFIWFEKINPAGNFMRVQFTMASGQLSSSNVYNVKGGN